MSISHKRGDTFSHTCTFTSSGVPVDLTNCTPLAQLRTGPDESRLVSTLDVTLLNQVTYPGQFTLSKGYTEVDGTHTWPLEKLYGDVQMTFPGGAAVRQTSKTFTVLVVRDESYE